MSTDEVKAALDRVLHWSRQRQEDVAQMLKLIEEHDKSPYELSDEQAAEVRRRLAEPDAPSLTLAQLDNRLRRLGV